MPFPGGGGVGIAGNDANRLSPDAGSMIDGTVNGDDNGRVDNDVVADAGHLAGKPALAADVERLSALPSTWTQSCGTRSNPLCARGTPIRH